MEQQSTRTRTHIPGIRIELEVTPDWWDRFGAKQMGNRTDEGQRNALLVSRSMLLACDAFTTAEIRVSRNHLKLVVILPNDHDVTFATITEKASRLRDCMNALAVENPGSQGATS